MNLVELVGKNIKSHSRSYVVYFFSLVFSVMVYYSFMTLSHDAYLQQLLVDNQELAGPFRSSGFFIVLFVVMFMFTATGFFIKNRQREIGLYLLLGMRKFRIGLIFFLESVLIGLASLIVGLLAGLIFTRLFALILLKVLVIQTDSPFLFSLAALNQTVSMFLPILFFVSLRGMYIVYRYQLIDLFQGQQRSSQKKKPGLGSWLLGVLGVVMLGWGYYQGAHFANFTLELETKSGVGVGLLMAMGSVLFSCVVGTYFIFKGFLPLILVVLTKSSRFYYQKMHMVALGNLQFYLKENARTLGTMAILLGTSLAALAGATYFYIYTLEKARVEAPSDFIVSSNKAEFIKSKELKQVAELEVKVTGGYFPERDTIFYSGEGTVMSLISVSQYEQFTKQETVPTLTSNDGLLLKRGQIQQAQRVSTEPKTVFLADQELPISIKSIEQDILGGDRSVRYGTPVLVLRDQLYEKISTPVTYSLVYFDLVRPEESLATSKIEEMLPGYYRLNHDFQWRNQQVVGEAKEEAFVGERDQLVDGYWRDTFFDKRPFFKSARQTYGLVVYVAIFLGIVFLVATGSIITVKQLAEFSQGRARYQLMLKLGVPGQRIKKSIFGQNAVVFFSPLLIGSLHAYFAIAALKSLLNGQNQSMIWLLSLIFLGIYSLFYYFTSRSCYRLVMK